MTLSYDREKRFTLSINLQGRTEVTAAERSSSTSRTEKEQLQATNTSR